MNSYKPKKFSAGLPMLTYNTISSFKFRPESQFKKSLAMRRLTSAKLPEGSDVPTRTYNAWKSFGRTPLRKR